MYSYIASVESILTSELHPPGGFLRVIKLVNTGSVVERRGKLTVYSGAPCRRRLHPRFTIGSRRAATQATPAIKLITLGFIIHLLNNNL